MGSWDLGLMFFLVLRTASVLGAPAQSVPQSSPRRLFKRVDYNLACFPENPLGPYPLEINMAQEGTNADGSRILAYDDVWGERQYLYDFTNLCDRAGCHCEADIMVCYNWGYVLFENALYNWYEDDCVLACHCEEPETGRTTSSSTNSTWSSADSKDQDWAEENAQLMREHYATLNGHSALRMNRTHNRLNTQLPCRAGEAAGWVFESRALKDCCPGYLFNALTAQEAYVNYGVPISYIIAGVISIGICLKPKPG